MGHYIKVLTTDELLDFLRTKKQAGQMSFNGPNIEVLVTSEEDNDTINAFSDALIEYYNFGLTDGETNLTHSQEYNYGALNYELSNNNETQLFSMYNNLNQNDIVERNDILAFEGASTAGAGSYVNIVKPPAGDSSLTQLDSIHSGSFPRSVVMKMPSTNNLDMLNILNDYDGMFEAFTDSLAITSFQDVEVQSINGPVSIKVTPFRFVHNNIILNPENRQSKVFSESEQEEIDPLVWADFRDNVESTVGQAFNFSEVIQDYGANPYNSVVCYEVTKSKSGSQIQTFFISPEQINFYDTQIFSKTDYDYQIHAYVATIRTFIKFQTFINEIENEPTQAVLTPAIDSQIAIIKLPISSANITTKTYAPTTPEITFINQSDEANKFRIFLEQSFIDHRAVFQPLIDSDLEVDKYTFNGIGDDSSKTIFKISSAGVTYEIYKVNQKPTSYLDFENSLAISSVTNSNNAVVNITLTPNRKFYLLFRTVDSLGIPSNPSPVYEVELIKDSDETRIVHKTINFEQKLDRSFISFGRFLKIYPAFDQLNINKWTDQSQIPNTDTSETFTPYGTYYVGDAEVPIWGRKMKFRIRSKNTGKIVDINVDFVINNKQSEQEFNTSDDEELR